MKSPSNGCLLLEQLRTNGQFLIGFNPVNHQIFRVAQQTLLQTPKMPAFLDTVDRLKKGDRFDYTLMKPPFEKQWIEVAGSHDRMGFYVTSERTPEGADLVHIVGYHPTGKQIPNQPRGVCAIEYLLDDQGNGRVRRVAPIFADQSVTDNDNGQILFAYSCVRTLQTMAAINVGFFEVRNAAENDKSLPRASRRAWIGRRYHILTLRDAKAVRRGEKFVTNPGSMPLNTARGHWARYGIEGREKLFNLYTGRYWIPAHARGKASRGIVEKDYKLGVAAAASVQEYQSTPAQESAEFAIASQPHAVDVQQPQHQEKH